MAYTVEFSPGAARDFRKLAREIQHWLRPRIDALADQPRPSGAKKLKASDELWRIRVRDYRIVYEIRDRILVVLVVRVAHRREVYRWPAFASGADSRFRSDRKSGKPSDHERVRRLPLCGESHLMGTNQIEKPKRLGLLDEVLVPLL
jgi:mRNA interferase RelE/StbE